MSSFKRKVTSKQPNLSQGTRSSPSSAATIITSTGIPSLDDILGGGIPLSCSCVILAPDSHSAYGELIAKYFIAQGLIAKQRTLVIGDYAKEFVSECMWVPGASGSYPAATPSTAGDDDDDDEKDEEEDKTSEHDNKVRIAWRYEQMKKFQTTVNSSNTSTDKFCSTFDLTCRIPSQVISDATAAHGLCFILVSLSESVSPLNNVLRQLAQALQVDEQPASRMTRICVPHFGSAEWGDINEHDVVCFLYHLRQLLRQYPQACAMIFPASYLCDDQWGGPGWVQKLAWVGDSCVTLSAFAGDPSLTVLSPSHHGLVQIHSLPAPHTLLPPSDRFSTLRGVSSSASSAGGVGENNLAFKCMRKRLIFETLHLDVEGGVGERRTAPSTSSAIEAGSSNDASTGQLAAPDIVRLGGDTAAVQVGLEDPLNLRVQNLLHTVTESDKPVTPPKLAKAKKKVAFRSEAPDLYDF